jgi:Bacterial Ig-like domain (group 3)
VIGYAAAPGFDLASGWGSIDVSNFVNAFATQSSSRPPLAATTTVLTSSTTTATINTSLTFTATIVADSGSSESLAPTGSVQFAIDGASAGTPVTLSASSVATYANTFTTSGSHTVVATYSGNGTYSASSSTLTFTIPATTGPSTASFTLAASNASVKPPANGTSTITVTPAQGFTGTVAFTVSAPSTLTNSCYSAPSAVVSGATAVTGTITIYTTEAECISANRRPFAVSAAKSQSASSGRMAIPTGIEVACASVFLLGFSRRRKRLWSALLGIAFLGVLTWGVGCGGGGGGSTNAPAGSYSITVSGQGTSTSTIAATTTFTLTVQ